MIDHKHDHYKTWLSLIQHKNRLTILCNGWFVNQFEYKMHIKILLYRNTLKISIHMSTKKEQWLVMTSERKAEIDY
jgi:hypothetical protein